MPIPDAATGIGSGGAVVGTGGALGTGGAPGSGGSGVGGGSGTGGAPGAGGTTKLAGNTGAGGTLGSGGAVGSGGASVVITGGRTGVGGSQGTGGRTGSGGASGRGGVTTGGVVGSGGGTGSGGGLATGGTTGAGGSTTTVVWPAKFVGNIDTRGTIRSDFIDYWDQFTPENAGKWGSVQAASTTFNWTSLDAMYKYCDEHGIVFKEMTFIWGAGQPSFLGNLDTTTGPAAVKNWMKSFCDRYPKTRIIDVVSEPPPHTTPTYAKVIGGGTNTTWDWIANSFLWAREACPGAVLLMNDYNNIELAGDVQHTIDIVTAIKQLGAPIDAIGCQAHGTKTLTAATLKANIDKLVAATGLPVYITQYDIGVADDEEQRRLYEDHITMFWSHPDVKGISVWGYIQGATWITNSGIMNSDGTMRPAMTWLMGFLGR